MPLDRKDPFAPPSRSGAALTVERKDSTRQRPHSSVPAGRTEPKAPTESVSSLAALGIEYGGGLSRENSKKDKINKERERKPKMDVARASGIMGFSSGRWLDKSTKDTDPKKELDKALFTRMQDLLKKKREFQKEKAAQQDALVSFSD